MYSGYADVSMLVDGRGWADRAPHLPMIGFIIGTGLSLMLWGVIGWSAWLLLV